MDAETPRQIEQYPGGGWRDLARLALERLDPERRGFWRLEISPMAAFAVVGAGLVLFTQAQALHRWFWWLDGANLLIHEAGHPIFGLLFAGNRFMMFAGGTALQLILPLAFYGSFLSRGQARSADVVLLWFGENFLHIAPYAADARAMDLPLIGGGEHDWNYLLAVFGLLQRDRQVADLFNLAGCLIIAFSVYALCAHWHSPRTAAR